MPGVSITVAGVAGCSGDPGAGPCGVAATDGGCTGDSPAPDSEPELAPALAAPIPEARPEPGALLRWASRRARRFLAKGNSSRSRCRISSFCAAITTVLGVTGASADEGVMVMGNGVAATLTPRPLEAAQRSAPRSLGCSRALALAVSSRGVLAGSLPDREEVCEVWAEKAGVTGIGMEMPYGPPAVAWPWPWTAVGVGGMGIVMPLGWA